MWALNERGEEDIVIVDSIDHDEKEHNVGPLKYEAIVGGDEFRQKLAAGDYDQAGVEAIFHLGANSNTVGNKKEYEDVNVVFSQEIIRWSTDRGVRCVYASSAATYGDGGHGYKDDHDEFESLKPMNEYGKSKLAVDIWARDAGYLEQVVGLKYFNVFGPNEWHKESMRSVAAKKFEQIQSEGKIELFKSTSDYEDGGQMRDFIYVKDTVEATLFFMDHGEVNGVFNVGSGEARTWNDLAKVMFKALGKEENIQYVDMPETLVGQYQDFTKADISKLKKGGYKANMTSLEEAVTDYIHNYLVPHRHLGE